MSRSSFRVAFRVAGATLLTVSAGLVVLPSPAANAVSADIVISQVYGAGGNTGATYQRDFIELFNRGAATATLTGMSVQYASTAGTSWQMTTLPASGVAPGQYLLVAESTGSSFPGPSP